MSEAGDPGPGWLRDVFGPGLRDPRRLRWGFTHETWAATVGGRELVATRMDDAEVARRVVTQGPELVRRLAGAGVASPSPDTTRSRPDLGIVVATFIEGTPGIEVMADEAGARLVGGLVGATWTQLRGVDPSGMGLDDLWARPTALRAIAGEWLAGVAADLTTGQRSVLGDRVATIESLLAGRRPGLVHGDLVPVNLLVRGDRLGALLDLEAAHVGEPQLDAAWFSWILRHHHPEIEPAASEAFAARAGIDRADERTAALHVVLPSIRILEIVDGLGAEPSRRERWLQQLRASTGV